MADCPYCGTSYAGYSVVGVLPANEHLTDWLEPVPVAQLFCDSCGRYTYMHPDHPDIQRMSKGQPIEQTSANIRTLNISISDVGDEELRQQFERGRGD